MSRSTLDHPRKESVAQLDDHLEHQVQVAFDLFPRQLMNVLVQQASGVVNKDFYLPSERLALRLDVRCRNRLS